MGEFKMKKLTIALVGLSMAILLTGCNTNKKAESPSSGNTATSVSKASESSSTVASSNTAESSATGTTQGTTVADLKVSLEDAIKLYQAEYPNTDITGIDLDTSFGKFFYKVEGMSDDTEYEVKIDAETKAIQKEHEEKLDPDEQNGVKRQEEKLDLSNVMGVQEVADIALKEVGAGEATDWSLDKDLGTTYWEVKIQDGNKETEVKINAQTGEVLQTEID